LPRHRTPSQPKPTSRRLQSPRASHSNEGDRALSAELAALLNFSRDALKERWSELYGAPPPSHLGRPILLHGIAYRIQEQIHGGLDHATRARLDRAARDLARGREPSGASAVIQPGTRLYREWRGVVHEVVVLDGGVQYREKTWPSLSAVAREITGARWSGPLFFGLRGRKQSGS
jgi:hypothetical protein